MKSREILKTIIGSSLLTTILLSVIVLIFKTWIVESISLALEKKSSRYSMELQWESMSREKAEKVAEYLALTRSLNENSSLEQYNTANQLSWELAMWLPDDIYKEMTRALISPNADTNFLSVIISTRKLLLKERAGDLNQDDIAHHRPGLGTQKKTQNLE